MTPRQPDLGPGVLTVIGADDLASVHPLEDSEGGVAHLRTVAQGRHIMVIHDRDPSSTLLPSLAERLLWLDRRGGAPELIASAHSDDLIETLVIRMSAEAVVAADPLVPIEPGPMARLVGSSLRAIHEMSIDGCPFESSARYWREAAASRVAHGLVPTANSGPYAGLRPQHLLEVLDDLLAASADDDDGDDRVLIHGMPTQRHSWFMPDGSVVFTGWQKCGIGDRHHDLAVAAADLASRFGPALVPPMIESYGIDSVAPRRLDLHQLLVYLCGVVE